jgi:hypothetical protein
MISVFRKHEYFSPHHWTTKSALIPFANFDFPSGQCRAAFGLLRDAILGKPAN